MVVVVTVLAHGCPVQVIVVAFGLDERTVHDGQMRAGRQCEQVHSHLVQQARDVGQVQADELRVKRQAGIVWMGGVVSSRREFGLIVALLRQVRACALPRARLLCVDGFSAYVCAFRQVFRDPARTGQAGRPRLRLWKGLCIGQVGCQSSPRWATIFTHNGPAGGLPSLGGCLYHTRMASPRRYAWPAR